MLKYKNHTSTFSNLKGGVIVAYEIYRFTLVFFSTLGCIKAATTLIDLPFLTKFDKKVALHKFIFWFTIFTIAILMCAGTLKTDFVEERIVESYTLVPFSDGEYYREENGFLVFCHFSEPDEHFWLSTDLSTASEKTVEIEKIAANDISIREVFSPDYDKNAFEIIRETTVRKAELPFGIVLTSNRLREKDIYRLELITLDESLPKTSYS